MTKSRRAGVSLRLLRDAGERAQRERAARPSERLAIDGLRRVSRVVGAVALRRLRAVAGDSRHGGRVHVTTRSATHTPRATALSAVATHDGV